MSTVITGSSGHLGRLAVDHLRAAGRPPAQIVATGREVGTADADLARGGLYTASADPMKLIGRQATTAHEAIHNAATIEASR